MQALAYLLMSAASAATEVFYLTKYGSDKSGWDEKCSSFGKFCNLLMICIALSLFSVILLATISILSAKDLFKHYVKLKLGKMNPVQKWQYMVTGRLNVIERFYCPLLLHRPWKLIFTEILPQVYDWLYLHRTYCSKIDVIVWKTLCVKNYWQLCVFPRLFLDQPQILCSKRRFR